MTYDEIEKLRKIEYKLKITADANRDRIDELLSYETVKGMRECAESKWHDAWMKWQDELWNRLNWATHLNCVYGMMREKMGNFIISESRIKWTLEDYVYSK